MVSPTFTTPFSILPVTTVPRPEIEKTSSIGIKKSLSVARTGVGIYSSTLAISSRTFADHSPSVPALASLRACRAEPATIGVSSPGKSYSFRSSRISISTSSRSSASSTISALFINTTI